MSSDRSSVIDDTPPSSVYSYIDNPRDDEEPLRLYRQTRYCCSVWTSDFYTAYEQEASNFPFGHSMPREYSDFRSSSRAKQRKRKIRENKGGCHSYRCRKQGQAEQRIYNLKKKRLDVKVAVSESQKIAYYFKWNGSRWLRLPSVTWDTQPDEEIDYFSDGRADDFVWDMMREHGADAFTRTDEYVQLGETFAVWCQRRIAEMRAVKESRIRCGEPAAMTPMRWERKHDRIYFIQYNIYTGDERTTTLPTNAYDACGHELLRSILTPSDWFKRRQLIRNAPLLQPIHGYRWFGEHAWAWYRNKSGCWEIGYDAHGDARPCYHGYLSCPFCCKDKDDMEASSPEETQECSLVEWIDRPGKEILLIDEARNDETRIRDHIELGFENGSDCGWEVISVASSEGWDVVESSHERGPVNH
ncbi:hypothetical protein ACEQ8H_002348 [Pleosporales sp. CAS-2024a]